MTPSFNQGRFIARTVESVLAQRYPALEYIVMDGGSSDETLVELERYRGSLATLHSAPDSGQANAINAGFAGSSGEIMAWLNSDDLLLPGALAHVAGYLSRHPEVDFVYGHRHMIDEHDRDIGIEVTPRHSADLLSWYDLVPQDAAFWRRRLWERCGGLDESLAIAFDWDLFWRFQASGARIVRLPRFLSAYRQHARQKTQARRPEARAEHALIRERIHGRPVGVEEARAQVATLMLRTAPYYAFHLVRNRARSLARRGLPGDVKVPGGSAPGAEHRR